MSAKPWPCVICGGEVEALSPPFDYGHQPYKATTFTTRGHYGSTVFDPMDGSMLEINIHDACLLAHQYRVGYLPRMPIAEQVREPWTGQDES